MTCASSTLLLPSSPSPPPPLSSPLPLLSLPSPPLLSLPTPPTPAPLSSLPPPPHLSSPLPSPPLPCHAAHGLCPRCGHPAVPPLLAAHLLSGHPATPDGLLLVGPHAVTYIIAGESWDFTFPQCPHALSDWGPLFTDGPCAEDATGRHCDCGRGRGHTRV